MDALDLLSGDAQTFVEKVWASHVHVHRTEPDELVGLLSFADVDHLLTSAAIRTPAVRVARDGAVLPASAFTRSGSTLAGQPLTGLVDARKVADLFEAGATVVLQGPAPLLGAPDPAGRRARARAGPPVPGQPPT